MPKKTKLLLIGGITGGAVVIGAVLLVLWLTVWSLPTKEDFVAAKKDAETIANHSALSEVGKFITATNAQYNAGKTGQALVEAGRAERDEAIEIADKRSRLAERLDKSKVLRDAEVKKAYEVYAPIEVRYRAYVHNYTNEYPVYLTSTASCRKTFNLNAAGKSYKQLAKLHATYMKPCLADLAKLETSPIAPYVTYAKEYKDLVDDRQETLVGLANGTMTITAATKRLSAENEKYFTIYPQEEMKKYRKQQVFNGELKKLIKLLEKKAEQAS